MNLAGKPLLIGDALEELRKLIAFLLGQRGQQRSLMLARDFADGREGFAALIGQRKGVAAAIVLISAPLRESESIELVEQGNQPARDHAQHGGQRLLGDPRTNGQNAQDAGMGRGQMQFCDPFSVLSGCVAAKLRQQKGSA